MNVASAPLTGGRASDFRLERFDVIAAQSEYADWL
jgi:hypothetical protein